MKITNKKYTTHTPNDVVLYQDKAEIILRNVKHKEVGRAIIDLDDVEKIIKYKWSLGSLGYCQCRFDCQNNIILLHKFIMNKPNMIIDHINRNKLDNRKCNLRYTTFSLNTFNSDLRKDNTSNITGVHLFKRINKWQVYINKDSKRIHLGYFENLDDAINIRREAEKKYYGEVR